MTLTLVCIDLQRGAFDGARCPPLDGADELLSQTAALQGAARRAGVPVVHVRHVESDAGSPFEEGTPHAELHPAVAPWPGEAVITKRVGDAFEGTDLHARLQALGADTLVLCGLQSDFCVRATAHGALRHGYPVRLAAQAHGTWPYQGRSAPQIMQAVQDELAALGVPARTTGELFPVSP